MTLFQLGTFFINSGKIMKNDRQLEGHAVGILADSLDTMFNTDTVQCMSQLASNPNKQNKIIPKQYFIILHLTFLCGMNTSILLLGCCQCCRTHSQWCFDDIINVLSAVQDRFHVLIETVNSCKHEHHIHVPLLEYCPANSDSATTFTYV